MNMLFWCAHTVCLLVSSGIYRLKPILQFNKFSVVPQHFLLVTKGWISRCIKETTYLTMHMIEFHSQTSPLLPPDLVQTYRLIAAAREAGKVRLEGKEYEVKDGDIIHFRFNV